jgi:hypothetical protein
MKKLIAVVFLLAAGLAKAQAPNYDDLRILYADGNYDKLIRSAENYSTNEKTKKDALPHFWLGRGLYSVSLSGTDEEKYKNAFKESVNSIGKAIKLDKSGEVLQEYDDFLTEYKTAIVERIRNDIDDPKVKNSAWVVKYYKMDPNSVGTKYVEGYFKYKNADKTGANTLWKDADTKLKAISSIEGWDEPDVELLKMGVLATASMYKSSKQVDKARALLGSVKQWYEEDDEFMSKYDEIVN